MAGGYPIKLLGVRILTSEALFQALKHTGNFSLQTLIFSLPSPMTAAMEGRRGVSLREDWDSVKLRVMDWVVRVKLLNNWDKFSKLLLSTGTKPIVEKSRRDGYWGTIEVERTDGVHLVGENQLGLILENLREEVRDKTFTEQTVLQPLEIPDFTLFGIPIPPVVMVEDGFYED